MKYDIEKCYWCGKHIGEGNQAYTSIATDTIKTMRNFCCPEHIQAFRAHAERVLTRSGWTYRLSPYKDAKKPMGE